MKNMLTEFLREHPAETLLKNGTRTLYPPAEDREAWDGIPANIREEIRAAAAEYASVDYPVRSASGFLAFVRTGDRQADEKPYFTRRRKLCAAVLNACAFPGTYMDDVIDGIWMICEESSWVISAHNVNPIPGAPAPAEYPLPDIRKPYIDLFCAQTGMILSLALSLLGKELDRVSPLIRERIRSEIRERILEPFMATDDFWWMGVRRRDLNNWTPWILSNILVCAILDPMPDKELAAYLTRSCEMLDRYIDTLPADGGCDEGAGYWNMAGGSLLDCLTLMETVTGGGIALWDNEKIRNILSFPVKAELGGGWFVNFADCDARPYISGERMEKAGTVLNDAALAALGTRMRGTVGDQLKDVPHLTRALDLVFHPPVRPDSPAAKEADTWLPDLQVRVARRGRWVLACKGGHNGENHNHNDAGSFILTLDGEPAVVDAGNMVYTAKTFSEERYTLWNVRSAWHNVPMIGGQEQREGTEHAARDVRYTPDGLEMNLEAAYAAEAGVRSLRRSFELKETGLRVTDTGRLGSAQEITWTFLLRDKPEIRPGRITAGKMLIRFPACLQAGAEEKQVTDPRMARNWPGSLWRVTLQSGETEQFRAEFEFCTPEAAEA